MYKLGLLFPCFFLISFSFFFLPLALIFKFLEALVSLEKTTEVFLISVILAGSYQIMGVQINPTCKLKYICGLCIILIFYGLLHWLKVETKRSSKMKCFIHRSG